MRNYKKHAIIPKSDALIIPYILIHTRRRAKSIGHTISFHSGWPGDRPIAVCDGAVKAAARAKLKPYIDLIKSACKTDKLKLVGLNLETK